MPIYEYTCPECDHTFEKLQLLREGPVALCPQCGSPAEKIMSASVGYIMKGENPGRPRGGRGAQGSGPCCGQQSGCDNPKRCCTK